MLSKKVLDAMRDEFNEEFGELSERDGYIQQMKAEAFALIGSMGGCGDCRPHRCNYPSLAELGCCNRLAYLYLERSRPGH